MREGLLKDIKAFYPAIIAFAVYNIVVRKIFHAYCPFLIVTGFPCAGCGMTRAVFYIFTGQIKRGMDLNPAAPMWILFLIWFFVNRYLRGCMPKYIKTVLAVVVLVTFGIYLYRMINFFPGSPPLVFYRNNMISRLLRRMKGYV